MRITSLFRSRLTFLTPNEKRLRLKQIIIEKAIQFKEVNLSKGKKSAFYYDIKSLINDPEGTVLIGELMLAKIKEVQPDVKSVGGLEIGAIPITTAIVYHSNQLAEGDKISGFFIRKEPKPYGLEKLVEGFPKTPVVVVDDVITTGASVLESVEALRSQGISAANIVSVIDRESDENILKNMRYNSLFKHSEFAEYINSKLQTQLEQ
jgi:orotate phosphoribosyltransferase